MNTPRKKYGFYDIIVFRKTPKGYVDITNFSFDDKFYFETSAYHTFESDSQYLLSLWFGNRYLFAPITVSELLLLANIKNNSGFISQCRYGIDGNKADDILAMMCANKLANHKYGSILLKMENLHEGQSKIRDTVTYEFLRKKSIAGKRVLTVLLEKTFKLGD